MQVDRIHLRFIASLTAIAFASVASAADPAGEQIYRKQCISCHGENGEGSKKYKKPLVGDKSVEQLTRLIAKTTVLVV